MNNTNKQPGAKRHKDLTTAERAIVIESKLRQFGAQNIGTGGGPKGFQIDSGQFLFVLGQEEQPDGFFVHVMADPAYVALVSHSIWLDFPKLELFGPYAKMKGEDGELNYVVGNKVMEVKKDLIMHQALIIRDQLAKEHGIEPILTEAPEASVAEAPEASQIIIGDQTIAKPDVQIIV